MPRGRETCITESNKRKNRLCHWRSTQRRRAAFRRRATSHRHLAPCHTARGQQRHVGHNAAIKCRHQAVAFRFGLYQCRYQAVVVFRRQHQVRQHVLKLAEVERTVAIMFLRVVVMVMQKTAFRHLATLMMVVRHNGVQHYNRTRQAHQYFSHQLHILIFTKNGTHLFSIANIQLFLDSAEVYSPTPFLCNFALLP